MDSEIAQTPDGWPIALLGVPFDSVGLPEAVDRVDAMVRARIPRYVVTANVDFLVLARGDTELRSILLDADLVLCDGMPIVWASHWLGNPLPGRVAGSDLVPLLVARAAERRWQVFLLGAGPGVAEEAARRMAALHPSLPEVAHFSPPYRPLHEMDNAAIIERIAAAKPDLLLVSLGCPKQEKWISAHFRQLGVPVAIGVGASLDFIAGRVKRAPLWMQRSGTEWVFRLIQEPRRLLHRYADDIRVFIPALAAQRRHLPATGAVPPTAWAPHIEEIPGGFMVRAGSRLDCGALRREEAFWRATLGRPGHCVVDLGEVRVIDSTGLAFLVRWKKNLTEEGGNLVIGRPSSAVRDALARSRLAALFEIDNEVRPAPGADAPREYLDTR